MFSRFINFKTVLSLVAMVIIISTIFYSNYIAKKIAADERRKIEQWAEAYKETTDPQAGVSNLTSKIFIENSIDIPIILVNEKDSLIDLRNMDSASLLKDKNYIATKIKEYKSIHQPIEWRSTDDSKQVNRIYYGESALQNEVRYYPIVQLLIVIIVITIFLLLLQSNYRSTQNQLWAGLAKETAHQLGTPVSSLEGWVEVLKEIKGNEKIVPEIEKDINRLLLITDRFGKIGSTPNLEPKDIVQQIKNMMEYIKKRAGLHVQFNLTATPQKIITAVSPPLFDWVIENLLKNALDAMEGKGQIDVQINQSNSKIFIEITDNGKGISKQNIDKVFKPGFTTKKRGWGLGLTLTRRIVQQYHKGNIYIKHSELNKGTTFKIELPV